MSVMNREQLKAYIDYFINHYKETQIDVMFVRKMAGAVKYKTYMLECRKNDLKDMIETTLKKMIKELERRELAEYDLIVSQDEVIQYVSYENVIHSMELFSQLTVDVTEENTLNEGVDFDKLDFLVIQMFIPGCDGKKMILLKKHTKTSTNLKKNPMRIAFVGKEYCVLTDKILSIGTNVEAFLVDNNYYIFNRNAFNTMLDYKDIFHKIVDENIQAIIDTNIFTDAEGFVGACKADGRYLPRLTKAIIHNGFGNVVAHRENIRKVKTDYGLDIEVTEDNQVVYEKPEDIPEILNLLLEHYVTSALTDNKMLAKAIEKYSI